MRLSTTARVSVQASIVAAVAAGCWLLQTGSGSLAVAALVVYVGTALLARFAFAAAAVLVLFFAYTHTGVTALLLPSFSPASFWLAALAGATSGGCSWTEWRAPRGWRWPLMLWLVGVAISWPIIAGREADFSVLLPGDGVSFAILTAISVMSAGLWLDTALTWDLPTIERRVGWPLVASALVAAAAVFYQSFVDLTWLNSEVWIRLQRAPGLMGDANPMAVAAALSAPLALLLLRGRTRLPIGIAIALLLWSAAWLTGARSVVLLSGAGAIGLIGGAVAARTTARRAAWVAVAAVAAGTVIVLLLSRTSIGGPIARLASTLPLDRPLALLYEVAWRRDGYGVAAVRAIREHPWSGVGLGAFYTVSSYFYRLEGGPLIPPDNAQNFWRHALAERGLLAFPAVVGFTIAVVRLLARRAEPALLAYAWTLKALTIGLGLVLMFGLPVQNAAIALTAASLLAWLHAAVAPRDAASQPLSLMAVGLMWVLAASGAAIDLWHARTDLRPPWRAARIGALYSYGFGEAETGRRDVSGRVVTEHATVALRRNGPRFNLQYWVRGTDARHVQVWLNRRLIMDELIPAGVVIERLLESGSNDGMMLEFATTPPGIVVSGEFVQ
jgi:hypothetical protein